MTIVDWKARFGDQPLELIANHHPSSLGDRTLPAPGIALDVMVKARVNASRWIADCPTGWCHGAEYVDHDTLLFFCCECRNAEFGHQPIRVEAPPERMRSQIEAYLQARPAPATRNWLPGETVEHLRAENREHGIRLEIA
jgi:hypothetical protein